VLFLAVASCTSESGQQLAQPVPLSTCSVQNVNARCGTLTVSEDPQAMNGRRIDLRVVVLPATGGHALGDPIVYFAGGPGGAATESVADMAYVMGVLNRDRDLVFVDQRGTGGSHKLTCPSDTNGDDLNDPGQLSHYLKSCLRTLDGDPRMYTTALAADDAATVLHALGYARVNVYGGSYGATIAQVFERRHRDMVRTMTLIGGTLLDVPIFELMPRNTQAALDDIFLRCANEPDCQANYPNLSQEWRMLLNGLTAEPVTVPADRSPSHQEVVVTTDEFAGAIHQLLLSADTAAQIPALVHSLATTTDRVSVVATYLDKFAGRFVDTSEFLAMSYTIRCSEPWARFDPAEVMKNGTGSYDLDATLTGASYWTNACATWPAAGSAAQYGPAAVADTPVLIINGTADPQDPPSNMAGAARLWPRSRQLSEPHQSHNIGQWLCQESIIDAFIEHGTADDIDTDCLPRVTLPAIPLTTG
jgi:pimeloyl-ACP methyl ester carboxylesterase